MANDGNSSRYKDKKRFFKPMPKKRHYLEAGLSGFFCTCNFREKDCVRESYNLLNEYADMFFTDENKSNEENDSDEANAPEDISDTLNKEINQLKEKSNSKIGMRRFQAVETGVANCVFIRSNIPDPVGFVSFIIDDLIDKKLPKTRFVLRLMPILISCKADMKSIIDSAGALFDKHFLKEPMTFSVVFNRRYNNSIMRDDVIKELADLVLMKNSKNKADLKNPELAIIVEVIKGICLLSVVPKYYQRKKYNICELGTDCKDDGKVENASPDSSKTELEVVAVKEV